RSRRFFTIPLNVRNPPAEKSRKVLRSQCWRPPNAHLCREGGWGPGRYGTFQVACRACNVQGKVPRVLPAVSYILKKLTRCPSDVERDVEPAAVAAEPPQRVIGVKTQSMAFDDHIDRRKRHGVVDQSASRFVVQVHT